MEYILEMRKLCVLKISYMEYVCKHVICIKENNFRSLTNVICKENFMETGIGNNCTCVSDRHGHVLPKER